jgi:hypothetical protein
MNNVSSGAVLDWLDHLLDEKQPESVREKVRAKDENGLFRLQCAIDRVRTAQDTFCARARERDAVLRMGSRAFPLQGAGVAYISPDEVPGLLAKLSETERIDVEIANRKSTQAWTAYRSALHELRTCYF